MWFEIIFLTLCVLVSSQKEKFKHEYIFDNFDEEFNYRYCDGDFPWIVTEYERLGVVPLNANNSKCIQATSKSCATSYPIDFSRGAIELDVYLQLLGNNSGLTVTLFSENNVPVIEHEVNRLKEDYTQGWNKILVHIENDMVGYLNLKGRSNKEEIIVVASVQYSEYVYTGKRQYYELLQIQLPFAMKLLEKHKTSARKAESESKIIDLKSETNEKYSKQRFRRLIDTSEGTTQSPKYFESDEGDFDQGKTTDKSSTTSESSPTETENSDSETVIVTSTTKGLDSNQTDNPDQDNNTTQTNSPEQDLINTTSSLTTVSDTDSESSPTETGNTDSETITSTTKDPDSNQTDNPEQDNNFTQTNNPEQDSTNITSSPTTVPDSDSESSPTETGNTDSETVTSTTKDPDSNQTNNPDQDNNTTQTNNPEQDSINTTSSPTTDSDSDFESSPTETGNTDSETVTSTTKDPDSNQTDNPDQDNNTTQTNNPEQDSTNTTSSPTTIPDSDSSTQDQQNNFTWSPFTITLVAVGSFVVLSVTAVSAYYCGKIRAQRDDTNFILDQVEDIKPQPIIPRVRNAKRVEV